MPLLSARAYGLKAVGPVVCLTLLVLAEASPALAQGAIRSIPGLTEVAVWETTSALTRVPIPPAAPQVLARLATLVDGSSDFSFYPGENYDVFYSNASGAPDPYGAFLTIEATWTGAATDGSMNITGAALVINGQQVLATTVASFRMGSRCVPSGCNPASVDLAVDGDLGAFTIPRMGATNPGDPSDRIRLTLGFPRPGGVNLELAPVAPVAPGEVLNFAWSNVGAASYTLGVVSGPGIGAPLVLSTAPCCATSFRVPPGIPPGTYRVAVSAGAVVSSAIDVVISPFPPPVLAPVPPQVPGGLLTFIFTPNPAVLYVLEIGPGPNGPTSEFYRGACCIFTLPVPQNAPAGTYHALIRGAGVPSNVVPFQILGSSGFELAVTSTIIRPGLRTTFSWTDRSANAGPTYQVFAGPAGAANLSQVATQGCCLFEVPWGAVPLGSYDVYVQDSTGLRTNRVTVRFDP